VVTVVGGSVVVELEDDEVGLISAAGLVASASAFAATLGWPPEQAERRMPRTATNGTQPCRGNLIRAVSRIAAMDLSQARAAVPRREGSSTIEAMLSDGKEGSITRALASGTLRTT